MKVDLNDLNVDKVEIVDSWEELSNPWRYKFPEPGDVPSLVDETPSALRVDPCGYSNPFLPATRSPLGRWGLYSDGYLNAADRLVEGLTGRPGEDELLYPIVCLYRHHLEMELKGRVYGCLNLGLSEEDGAKVKEGLARTHSLLALWGTFKKCYPDCDHEFGAPTQAAFRALLTELHNHDPDSQAARYPVDSKGNQTFPHLALVDPHVFREAVYKLSNYLRAIQNDMFLEVDWRAEMESW